MLSPEEIQASDLAPDERHAHIALRIAVLEHGPHLRFQRWKKSSHSGGGENNACVEVAHDGRGLTGVRDSKEDGTGPIVAVPDAAWAAFLRGILK